MQGLLQLSFVFMLSMVLTMAVEQSEYQVAFGNRELTKNLYEVLSKDSDDIFFSPLGIHTLLSMVYQGAEGTTKEALLNTLKVPEPSIAAEGYDHIITNINNIENVTLYMTNKAYIKEGSKLQSEFDGVIKEKFHSEVEPVDFEQAEAAANTINSWVSDQTKGKIPTLVSKDDFDRYTRLVLLNAIYFKGSWSLKFEKEATRTEPFFVTDSEKIDCQMMHKTGGFNYKNDNDLNAKVVELAFKSNSVSMIIALPNDKNGIADLEKKVQEHGVRKIFDGLNWNSNVIVALPKFKLEQTIELNDPLKQIGLEVLFNDRKSNLSKIVDGDRLYVSKAIQKTYVEVNEEGAEAAAVTGFISQVPLSAPMIPIYEEIYANHPFLLIIKEADHVLFYGKISRPVSGDSDVAQRAEPDYYVRPKYPFYY